MVLMMHPAQRVAHRPMCAPDYRFSNDPTIHHGRPLCAASTAVLPECSDV